MSEIPEDVMRTAREAVALEYEADNRTSVAATVARFGGMDRKISVRSAVRAIMAERERCKMRTAREALDQLDKIHFPKWGSQGLIEAVEYSSAVGAIARAILAERERCVGLVRAVKHMDEFDRAALMEEIRK